MDLDGLCKNVLEYEFVGFISAASGREVPGPLGEGASALPDVRYGRVRVGR